MLDKFTQALKVLLKHRLIVAILVFFLIECLALIVYMAVIIQPTDLQVVVHYTGYGSTNFYRDKWMYLLSFFAFVIIAAVLCTLLVYRILAIKGEQLAVAFTWLLIIVMAIASVTFYRVLNIASLS